MAALRFALLALLLSTGDGLRISQSAADTEVEARSAEPGILAEIGEPWRGARPDEDEEETGPFEASSVKEYEAEVDEVLDQLDVGSVGESDEGLGGEAELALDEELIDEGTPEIAQPASEIEISRPRLDPREERGELPVLIDAFIHKGNTMAYIIFSTKSMQKLEDVYTKLARNTWRCTWHSDGEPTRTMGPSTGVAVHLQRKGDSDMEDALRKTLVVRCKVPKGKLKNAVVDLSATDVQGGHQFKRDQIRIRSEPLFSDSQTALCTMVIKDAVASPYLHSWVKYHLNFGFDQILVYIEDRDASWAREVLRPYMDTGRVRLVHFYFGSLSDKRSFYLQQAQEQHCLYASKGRVAWLGHSDIDEYFQLRDPLKRIKGLLGEMSNQADGYIAAVSVQSQFWFFGSNEKCTDARFLPCDMTCKLNGYTTDRTKLILNPEIVDYYSVHLLTKYHGQVYKAHPDLEIRLNHFKFLPNGTARSGEECTDDLTWKNACRDSLEHQQNVLEGSLCHPSLGSHTSLGKKAHR